MKKFFDVVTSSLLHSLRHLSFPPSSGHFLWRENRLSCLRGIPAPELFDYLRFRCLVVMIRVWGGNLPFCKNEKRLEVGQT